MSTKPPSSEKDAPEDFWDLGDDDLDAALPVAEEVPATPESTEEESPEPEEVEDKVEIDEVKEAEELPAHRSSEAERNIPVESLASKIKSGIQALSLVEKGSIIILGACLLSALGWGISSFYKDAPQGSLVIFHDDFPVKGTNITVGEVETWWRAPIRAGDNADQGVVVDVKLIPCARIKLTDSGSSSILVTFLDGDRELVGDPITLSVTDGKFSTSGSNEIILNSTSGFLNPSELNAYTNEDITPWSIAINETSNQSSSEEPFLRVKIDPTYKED